MCGSNSVFVHFYILLKCVHPLASVSGWLVFLKSASLVSGLTKAFLGVGDNQKELTFSDHTHNLPDLEGILTADKGGTGVSSLGALKTALGISNISSYYLTEVWGSEYHAVSVPNNWRCYIALGSTLQFGYYLNNGDTYTAITFTSTSSGVPKLEFDNNRSYSSNSLYMNSWYNNMLLVFY